MFLNIYFHFRYNGRWHQPPTCNWRINIKFPAAVNNNLLTTTDFSCTIILKKNNMSQWVRNLSQSCYKDDLTIFFKDFEDVSFPPQKNTWNFKSDLRKYSAPMWKLYLNMRAHKHTYLLNTQQGKIFRESGNWFFFSHRFYRYFVFLENL